MIKSVSVLLLLLAATSATAQSASTVITALTAKYSSLRSYSHHASITTIRKVQEQVDTSGIQINLKFERPARLKIDASGPAVGGAVLVGMDAGDLVIYAGSKNQYQKKKGAANEAGVLDALAKLGLKTEIDPLAFLCNRRTSEIILAPRVGKRTTVNGVECNVIEGQLRLSKQVAGLRTQVSLYIDDKTGLIAKSRTKLFGVPAVLPKVIVKDGKRQTVGVRGTSDVTVTYVYSDVKANPALNPTDFQVDIPKGAVEYKLDTMLKNTTNPKP